MQKLGASQKWEAGSSPWSCPEQSTQPCNDDDMVVVVVVGMTVMTMTIVPFICLE